jgi:general secretion pathway protein D
MITRLAFVTFVAVCLAGPVVANEQSQPSTLPTTPLMDVLDAAAKNTGLVFTMNRRAQPDVVIGQADMRSLDYPMLLVILSNNDMAAVRHKGGVNIIPDAAIRQNPLPVLHEEDDSIADEEWVSMMIKVQNNNANRLVPILRPLVPQTGHMVADSATNTLTIVDRYGNIRKLLEMIRTMDVEASQRQAAE